MYSSDPRSSKARSPRPGCFGAAEGVASMPAVSSIVAACEMIRRGEADTVTLNVPTNDVSAVLAVTSETVDQAGVDLETRATATGMILTLRRREIRGER